MSENVNTLTTSTKKHGVVSRSADGKVKAFARNWKAVVSGNITINVRLIDLKEVDPDSDITVETVTTGIQTFHQSHEVHVNGNIVGLTIFQVNAGTTITVKVVAEGTA